MVLMLTGCAETRFQKQAEQAWSAGRYEEAVNTLKAGLIEYPESTTLRATLLRSRQETLVLLIEQAQRLQQSGDWQGARGLLERAAKIDPDQPRLRTLLQDLQVAERQDSTLQAAQVLMAESRPEAALETVLRALKENPRHPGLNMLRRQIEDEARSQLAEAGRDALSTTEVISLDFRDATLRTVLDLISRHSGVNYIVDRDVRPELRVSLLLNRTRVQDALDLLLVTNQLTKKVIDGRTILVYPNTPEKAKEYQEQLVRVFYLSSGEARAAAAFLRAMLRIGEPFVDERNNMLALRDSPENIRLAERLISLYDAGEPEVLLELEVLEVSARRMTELGVRIPDQISLSVLPPVGQTRLTLGNIGTVDRDRIGLGLGNVLINLKREVGDYSTLANPSIRVKNREKAKVLVGDKIPVISTVTGQAGFVSDSISYLDVGLKLDVEPAVYADDEVSIKVSLEVSTLGTAVRTAAGALAYQIGTRNASTWLRLRDGETQLLAGLISREERTSSNRIPGAGDLPVVGRLFSSTADNAQRTELVLAITPRILRNVRRPSPSEAEVWIGTEARPALRSTRFPIAKPDPASNAAPPGSLPGINPPPSSGPGVLMAMPLAQPVVTPATVKLNWQGPASIKVGETAEFQLQVSGAESLRALPMELGFDPAFWTFVDVQEGDFLRQGQAATTLVPSGSPESGSWGLSILRQQATGATGDGRVLSLRLRARKPGDTRVSLRSVRPFSASAVQLPTAGLPSHAIRIEE
jgi:general secretion pathway protein D